MAAMQREGVLYGIHAVGQRLQSGRGRIDRLLYAASARSTGVRDLKRRAEDLGIPVEPADRTELDRLSGGRHQGVVLVCDLPGMGGEKELMAMVTSGLTHGLLVVLDGVTDPQNLGACLRSCAVLNVDALVVPKDRSASLTPAAVKAASGAAELLPVYQVTNLARCLDRLKAAGLWTVGTAAQAPRSIAEVDLSVPLAVVLGSEGKGIRQLVRRKCDHLATITPLASGFADLNVSVACGIVLYEISRQRAALDSA